MFPLNKENKLEFASVTQQEERREEEPEKL